jgi:hypothetical protein
MSILIKEKDILFTAINILLFLYSFTYIILSNLSRAAYQMSHEVAPYESSGIYVFISFAEMVFVVAFVLVVLVDCWWVMRMIRERVRKYRKENL